MSHCTCNPLDEHHDDCPGCLPAEPGTVEIAVRYTVPAPDQVDGTELVTFYEGTNDDDAPLTVAEAADYAERLRQWRADQPGLPADATVVHRVIPDWTPGPPPPPVDRITLLPADADRATIVAHLDAHPDWELADRTGGYYITYRLSTAASLAATGRESFKVSFAAHGDNAALRADAVFRINAIAFNLDPVVLNLSDHAREDIMGRLTAIYRLAEPGSPIALIASGQLEPE
ncbi:hypothetical protein [Nonomuraea sp. NPDC003214]